MADPPGKVISSLTPSDKRNSKLGACADVFFHLFDWNRRLNGKRLLPHKSLPAERPSRNLKDEKLPMAKLLLIADENRGGFPKASSKESAEVLPKEKTPEKKSRKRSPGVVAKLMGLETMPSPEPRRQNREHEAIRIGTGARWRQDLSQERSYSMRNSDQMAASIKERAIGIDRKLSENYSGRENVPASTQDMATYPSSRYQNEDATRSGPLIRTSGRLDDPKPVFFSRLPPLSPRQPDSTFRSILSPSKSHNKLVSPIKSPLGSKNAVRLFEAAAKILEPSMQPRTRARNAPIQSKAVRPLLEDADAEETGDKKTARSVSLPRRMLHDGARNLKVQPPSENPTDTIADQKKCQQFSSMRLYSSAPGQTSHQAKPQAKLKQERKPSNACYFRSENKNGSQDHASAAQQASKKIGAPASLSQEILRRSGTGRVEAQAHPTSSGERLVRSKSGKEKAINRFNHDHAQLRAGKEEKLRSDLRKQQEQTCRRLSQSASTKNLKSKKVEAKQDRDPSPPQGDFHQRVNHEPMAQNKLHSSASIGESSRSFKSQSFSSTESSITTANSNSGGSSGILNYSRLFGSRRDVGMSDEGSKKKETKHRKGDSSLMKSLLRRKQIMSEESTSMEGNSPSSKADMISESENQSTPTSLQTKPAERIDETLISTDAITKASASDCDSSVTDGAHEITASQNAVYSSESVGTSNILSGRNIEVDGLESERMRARWSGNESRSFESESFELSSRMGSNMVTAENFVQSSYESSGDLRDTASSYFNPDVGSARRESVSYSGKTTAAILQELLLALNSSRSQFTVEKKPDDLRTSCTESCSESVEGRQLEGRRAGTSTGHKGSMALKRTLDGEKVSFQDCESLSGSVCNNKERNTRVAFKEENSICTTGGQTEDSTSADGRGVLDCDKLMDTISRLHHIDRSFIGLDGVKAKQVIENEGEYIKEIISSAKLSFKDICSARLPLSGPLVDAALFNKLEDRVLDWNSQGTSSEDEDAVGTCRSERDMSSRSSHRGDAAMQKRKLIFDCVNEVLSLDFGVGEGFSGFCSRPLLHPSDPTHLQRSTHRQMDDWRRMACGMNVDDMVEKEMSTGMGRWCNFGSEVSEIAEEMEQDIFRKLIEELMCEVSSSYYKIPATLSYQKGFYLGEIL